MSSAPSPASISGDWRTHPGVTLLKINLVRDQLRQVYHLLGNLSAKNQKWMVKKSTIAGALHSEEGTRDTNEK